MKKFTVMVLSVTTFFLGLGSLIGEVGAKFKSDERALALIRQARQAIGGDANIRGVHSLTITAKATQTIEVDGAQRSEQGDLEINLNLPNQFGKTLKLGEGDANGNGERVVREDVNVVVIQKSGDKEISDKIISENGEKKVFVTKNGDKTVVNSDEDKVVETSDGKKVSVDKIVRADKSGFRQNELLRATLSLLLSAPEGLDVNYVYAGEGSVDGFSCDIVDAQNMGSSIKLYLDKSSHLPRMMTFQGVKPFMIKIRKNDAKPTDGEKEAKVFLRQEMPKQETAEFQVKFSDYRTVNGVQLPFRWTQTVGGQPDQIVDVLSYEINPANIAEKFKNEKTFIRTKKN